MDEGEDDGRDQRDSEEDVSERSAPGVTPLPPPSIAALAGPLRGQEDSGFGRLPLLLLVGVGQEERGNVDGVVDVEVGERDIPYPRSAYRPRSRKQRMAAAGMRPSRGSPSAARRRRSVLEIANGGMRT